MLRLPARAPFALLVLAPLATAQIAAVEEDPSPRRARSETVVTALRGERRSFETPASTDVVGAEQIRERAYRTLPQALRDLPGVMVQETAHGQGSPYIRGFTGFRTGLLVDGIRVNNSVFRDGPNQYWNTIDPLSIERLEVVRGPSSVLYGSDAIGGTVNAITKRPDTWGPGTNVSRRFYYRGSTAEGSNIGRIEVGATRDQDFGVLVGLSGKRFGDVDGGKDIGNQPNTGYDEWDADVKVERYIDPHTRFVLAFQQVKQNDVPRTHQTIFARSFHGSTIGSDLRRDLDQQRQLAYAQLHGTDLDAFFDSYSVSLSWQDQEESRDRIRASLARDTQGFDVQTLGLFAHLSSDSSIGRLTYGFDHYHDSVDSFSSSNAIQGPVADDSNYDMLGVFVQDEIPVSERLDVVLGGRYNHVAADADRVRDPVTSTLISLEDDWSSVVGSARFVYRIEEDRVNLFGGVSQGFRAPNLSDLTRFDTARTNEFEIAAPGLQPEEYITYELGVKTAEDRFSSQTTVFYTDIDDQIVRFPTGNVNGLGEFEITKDNVGDGYVWGLEFGAAYELQPQWTVFGNSTYMYGRVSTFPTSAPVLVDEYIDRLMPWTSQLGVRWDSADGDVYGELVGVYATEADRLSTRDMGDTSRIPPGGTPAYLVFHARGGWRVNENVSVDLAVDNLTNEDYRIHGSGQNMPGLNFILGLSLSL